MMSALLFATVLEARGARFDGSGLLSTLRSGNLLKIWFADLKYTAGRSTR
jgi:hypothetical protein